MGILSAELVITLQQLEGVGNKTILKIADGIAGRLETIEDLINFWPSVKGKKFEAITKSDLASAYGRARRIIDESGKHMVQVVTLFDEEYPEILRSCVDETGKPDQPLVLYCRGNLLAFKKPGIAVIGTREPTLNGKKAGAYFAAEFAKRGFNIVSGLALGCDAAGHQGALSAGGTTTAFLANGLDWNSVYPRENLGLAQRIVDNGGLLLSEYAIGQPCGRYGLVARDRLQAGLSYATIVVQTSIKGGTMHAVRATIAANKPLFAVEYKSPADNSNNNVQGNLMLIQDKGAYPLSSTDVERAARIIEKAKLLSESKTNQTSLFGELKI